MLDCLVELEPAGQAAPSLDGISPHHRDHCWVVELAQQTELTGSLEGGQEDIHSQLTDIAHTDAGHDEAVTLQASQADTTLVLHLICK